MLDFEIRVDENANDRYGAFKVGMHDDLVTAIGLATQVDDVGPPLVSPISFVKPGGSVWRPMSDFTTSYRRPSDRPWHS